MVNKRRIDNIMFHRGLRKANKSNDAEDDVLCGVSRTNLQSLQSGVSRQKLVIVFDCQGSFSSERLPAKSCQPTEETMIDLNHKAL